MAKIVVIIAKTVMQQVLIETENNLSREEIKEIVEVNYPDFEVVEIRRSQSDQRE